jgi:hypothetical protein
MVRDMSLSFCSTVGLDERIIRQGTRDLVCMVCSVDRYGIEIFGTFMICGHIGDGKDDIEGVIS